MKNVIITICLFFIGCTAFSQIGSYKPTEENLKARKWFEEARFGMFVHFGASSVLGAGEWVMNNRDIKVYDYRRLIDFFNPQEFDAVTWVSAAKNAGMKYITLTSRHHDGFSNWNTQQSDWKITNTSYKKDLIKQLSEECQTQGIKLFFYYSLLDWYRNDYQWETGRTGKGTGRTAKSNWPEYIQFMKAQLTELLTEYGPIGGIWFDGHWDQTTDDNRTDPVTHVDWHYNEIYELIHQLQPSCLVANNHHLPPFPGEDFQIFERDLPGENNAGLSGQAVTQLLPLETCETMNGSWGFNITDDNYKSKKELIHLLVRAAGYGGNLLLNVGPMPNGLIQPEFVSRLSEIGNWVQKYGHTIYSTKGGFIKPQKWGAVTQKNNIYYIHLLNPDNNSLTIDFPENPKIKSVQWMHNPGKVEWKYDKKTKQITFNFNVPMDEIDTILEVTVNK